MLFTVLRHSINHAAHGQQAISTHTHTDTQTQTRRVSAVNEMLRSVRLANWQHDWQRCWLTAYCMSETSRVMSSVYVRANELTKPALKHPAVSHPHNLLSTRLWTSSTITITATEELRLSKFSSSWLYNDASARYKCLYRCWHTCIQMSWVTIRIMVTDIPGEAKITACSFYCNVYIDRFKEASCGTERIEIISNNNYCQPHLLNVAALPWEKLITSFEHFGRYFSGNMWVALKRAGFWCWDDDTDLEKDLIYKSLFTN